MSDDDSETKRVLRMGPVVVKGDFKQSGEPVRFTGDLRTKPSDDPRQVTGNCYKCGTLEHERKWDAGCFPGQVHAWQPPAGQQVLVARSDEPTDRLREIATAAAAPRDVRRAVADLRALRRRDELERWLIFLGGVIMGALCGAAVVFQWLRH